MRIRSGDILVVDVRTGSEMSSAERPVDVATVLVLERGEHLPVRLRVFDRDGERDPVKADLGWAFWYLREQRTRGTPWGHEVSTPWPGYGGTLETRAGEGRLYLPLIFAGNHLRVSLAGRGEEITNARDWDFIALESIIE